MPVIVKKVRLWKCGKCRHEWESMRLKTARRKKPGICPRCKSPKWDE